ncbi:uncharacterized protein LOC134754708, partial [Cydia strobilella]|uniref:uncharacterized protein LOC134754708 n=1 Tax=Cydia strobilella TaxID=1100964 RepID=UPI003003AC91
MFTIFAVDDRSHVYKLFSRVITNRLARRFDDFQPPEQAGFRKGYSTVDHIHALRQVIQKTEEYNLPLWLAFVDYEKAFDSIETWAVLQYLQRCQIDYRSKSIPLQRGVRQGDVISPKLFTAALEDAFKVLDCKGRGINVNGRSNFEKEVTRRIRLGWAAFGKLQSIFSSKLPQCLKSKVFDQCVLPMMTYGSETWALTMGLIRRLKVTQRAMERAMLGVSLRDRVRNDDIRSR